MATPLCGKAVKFRKSAEVLRLVEEGGNDLLRVMEYVFQ